MKTFKVRGVAGNGAWYEFGIYKAGSYEEAIARCKRETPGLCGGLRLTAGELPTRTAYELKRLRRI